MRQIKKNLIPPVILLGLAAAITAGLAPASSELWPPQEKKDLWIVTATFREETTVTLTDDWSITQKITPDELVRASQVTIKKVWHRTSRTTNVASIVTIVENEGGDDALVIYERPPVSTTIIGHRSYTSDEERTEHVNQYTSEGSEFRTIQDNISSGRRGRVGIRPRIRRSTHAETRHAPGQRKVYRGRAWKDISHLRGDGWLRVGCVRDCAHVSSRARPARSATQTHVKNNKVHQWPQTTTV
jgi:hypothetical protein